MKKIKWLVLLLALYPMHTFACLNGDSKMLKNKAFLYQDYDDNLPFGHLFFTENFPEMIQDLDERYRKTGDFDYLSDKGLILILQQKYSEALQISIEIDKVSPGRYSTASNMGTIYELIGNNQEALKWINRSIQINPKSHDSSEWLHSKILRAKINGASFYTSDFLIGTDFGSAEKPVSELTRPQLHLLNLALYFQLNERISFIKPTDKIIAQLLFDLGNIRIKLNDFYGARAIFNKAKEYGFDSPLIKKRMAYTQKVLKRYEEKQRRKRITSKGKITEIGGIDYIKTTAVVMLAILVLSGFAFAFVSVSKRKSLNRP